MWRMPVTAKLSRRFYERLGDEIANELVDWFNSVDATYQASLRELNELNFARFDAKLEQRIAGLERQLDARFAEQREDLVTRIASSESRMIRWMVTLWSSSILATLGLVFAVLRSK
jgi:hypothetical protein